MAGTEHADVVETLKRIEANKDVVGTIVVNAEGIPIRSTFDSSTTTRRYTEPLRQLTMMAQSTVRDIDPQNDLSFLRVRTKDHEILVSMENDFMLVTVQGQNK